MKKTCLGTAPRSLTCFDSQLGMRRGLERRSASLGRIGKYVGKIQCCFDNRGRSNPVFVLAEIVIYVRYCKKLTIGAAEGAVSARSLIFKRVKGRDKREHKEHSNEKQCYFFVCDTFHAVDYTVGGHIESRVFSDGLSGVMMSGCCAAAIRKGSFSE